MYGLPVEFSGELCCLLDVPAVHEPEPGRDGRGEVDAVLDKGQRGGSGDVLPLGTGGAAWRLGKRGDWT